MQKKWTVCRAVCIVAWTGEVFSVTVNLIWMVYYGAVFELAKLFSSCWVTENKESTALFSCIYLFCCCYCMFFFLFCLTTPQDTNHQLVKVERLSDAFSVHSAIRVQPRQVKIYRRHRLHVRTIQLSHLCCKFGHFLKKTAQINDVIMTVCSKGGVCACGITTAKMHLQHSCQ